MRSKTAACGGDAMWDAERAHTHPERGRGRLPAEPEPAGSVEGVLRTARLHLGPGVDAARERTSVINSTRRFNTPVSLKSAFKKSHGSTPPGTSPYLLW